MPVVSSVVKVKKFCNDGEDEEEEEDYGLRTGSISSSVSVPAKPERRYFKISVILCSFQNEFNEQKL